MDCKIDELRRKLIKLKIYYSTDPFEEKYTNPNPNIQKTNINNVSSIYLLLYQMTLYSLKHPNEVENTSLLGKFP